MFSDTRKYKDGGHTFCGFSNILHYCLINFMIYGVNDHLQML